VLVLIDAAHVTLKGQGHKSKFKLPRGKTVANVVGVSLSDGFLV